MQTSSRDNLYICPGETHPITRSIHLARMAAFFPACRDCPFRGDTAQLAKQTVERLQSTEKRVERKSLVTPDGIRGRYLNEINRKKGEQFAAALASLLWQQTPLVGQLDSAKRRSRRSGPAVVVGHDERPSSPDIITGVVSALRLMGCAVTDISLCTEPCFRFAVDHLQAAAGIYVTGAGHEPSWTGLNFVMSGAIPVSPRVAGQAAGRVTTLDDLELRMQQPSGRPTRQGGSHRLFQAAIPYEAGLLKHFHALRPLRVALGCPSRPVRETLGRLFANIPCQWLPVDIPDRARSMTSAADADVVRVGKSVRDRGAHVGVLIDHDGSRCAFLDEEGALVTALTMTCLIAELLLTEHRGSAIIVEAPACDRLSPALEELGGRCIDGGSTQAEMATTLRTERAIFGGGDSGRYWFGEAFPSCDAILTLARVLELLSRSDAPFSSVAGRAIETAASGPFVLQSNQTL
jgi:phosphomannomutase